MAAPPPIVARLAEGAVALVEAIDSGDLEGHLLEAAGNLLEADRVAVFFRAPDERSLELRASIGVPHDEARAWTLPVDAALAPPPGWTGGPLRVDGKCVGAILAARSAPFTDEERAAFAAFRHIAEAIAAAAVLRSLVDEARRDVELVASTAPDAIVRRRDDGSLDLVNPAARELAALPGAEEAIADLAPDVEEVHLVDDRVFAVRSASYDEDGRRGTIFLLRDLSESRRRDAVLRQAEKLAAVGTLLAKIAHEVNNPLTFIRVNTELALDAVEQEATRAMLRQNLTGIDRIAGLLHGVKMVAKPGRGMADVDLNEVVRTTAAVVAPRMKDRVRLDLGEVPTVRGSFQDLSQIFLNLLLNAADALDGREDAAISLTTRVDGGTVVATVADNGPGIPAEVAARLFSPFVTSKPSGTGLGLCICREIAESHGGSLSARNGASGGAVFELRLPLAAPAPPS